MVNRWSICSDRIAHACKLGLEGHRLEAAQLGISLGTLAGLGQVNILPFSRDLCAKVGTLIRSPIFSTQLSVPALNLLTRATNCAWFSPVPLARRVARYRLRRRAIDSAVDVVGLGCGITPAIQGALLHGTSMLPAFG